LRIIVEIPEENLARLLGASMGNDDELKKYLAAPSSTMLHTRHRRDMSYNFTSGGDALAIVDNICCCFHLVVKRLGDRYDNRPTLEVKDEYDVQDLLNAILYLHFRDIRREEWIPSYAGKNARADFLLKEESTIIETKMARENLRDSQLHDQLIVDIEHYKAHPHCERLVCFVYDPHGLIRNPKGIENDLNRQESDFEVRVKIAPRGL
jgi:hypothetical protein